MTTKTKKWSAPKGWDVSSRGMIQEKGDEIEGITGVRTYPDGTEREILAHSEDEFDMLAGLADDHMRRWALQRQGELNGEIERLQDRLKDLKAEAKQYDWAT